jgi:four helix bundle protein
MNQDELKDRTKKFALRILKLVDSLPNSASGKIIKNQLGRAGTSVGANYRAACKARSRADFVSKITIVEEEADECMFWLELIMESGMIEENKVKALWQEAKELTAIFTSTGKTARQNRNVKR